MKIKLSEPVVVARGPESEKCGWGPYQFPELSQLKDGRLLYNFNAGADCVTAYGDPRPYFISDDQGKSWKPVDHREVAHLDGLLLPNGDLLRYLAPPSIPREGLELPKPLCTSPKEFDIFDLSDIPEGVCAKTWQFVRVNAEHPEGVTELVTLHWPHMFTGAAKGVLIQPFPQGRLRLGPDGSLWMPHYMPAGIDPENGSIASRQYSVYLLHSQDYGHSWNVVDFLPFVPKNDAEAVSEGYNENDIGFAPDGSMFRLIRTHVIYKESAFWPMLFTRSTDGGKTWSKPVPFDFTGVWPTILTLKCGVTLATYGRPGLYLRATEDPSCQKWEDPVELIHSNRVPNAPGTSVNIATCSYTDLIPLSDRTAGLAYSDFTQRDEEGKMRKTMMFRTITIED